MPDITFTTPEFQANGQFQQARYRFWGDVDTGWQIERNGESWMALGPGYELIETRYCGVCATDLARQQLPFPLPQITGHEAVGMVENKPVAIEINATHAATRHGVDDCPWCRRGLEQHCPERLTLGIDRLPGGFAPWLLAPVGAIHPLPDGLSVQAGTLIEPLAAALKAVETRLPQNGETVAVLGPRRLGMLLLAALSGVRSRDKLNFTITAVVRHSHLERLCRVAGADEILLLNDDEKLLPRFDIVYDTTGKAEGFASALALSKQVVHLKSTHGHPVEGLKYLTDMVINEQSLKPYQTGCLSGAEQYVYLSADVSETLKSDLIKAYPDIKFMQGEAKAMFPQLQTLQGEKKMATIPAFDAAIVTSLADVDQVLRLQPDQFGSLLKPQASIYLTNQQKDNSSKLMQAIQERNLQLHSSRCGSFQNAIQLLQSKPAIVTLLEQLISHESPLTEIAAAFELAAESRKSIKVVIQTRPEM